MILKQRNIILSLLGVMLMLSCSKQNLKLPAKTREGRNTIGYIIDKDYFFGGQMTTENIVQTENGSIEIMYNVNRKAIGMGLKADRVDYTLTLNLGLDSLSSSYSLQNGTFYRGDFEAMGYLNPEETNVFDIAYSNPDEHILSGLFELYFARVDSLFNEADSIYIIDYQNSTALRDGRFDIKY